LDPGTITGRELPTLPELVRGATSGRELPEDPEPAALGRVPPLVPYKVGR